MENKSAVFLSVLLNVFFVEVCCGFNLRHQVERPKRQNDRWLWDNSDSETTNLPITPTSQVLGRQQIEDTTSSNTTTYTTVAAEDNPCKQLDKYKPTVPDFSAPGRTISKIKCAEYIWAIYVSDKRKNLIKACKYINNPTYIIYAKVCEDYRAKVHNSAAFAIGGRDTRPGEFPHMAAIGWKAAEGTWVFKCGGSLISPKFVLTAAHCSRASALDTTIADPKPKIVRLGDKNIIDRVSNHHPPHDVNISRTIVHPQYSAPKKYFDIALMELAKDVYFNIYIQPACLWNKADTSSLGKQATLTGWGVVETGSRKTSPELQAAVVDVVDSETCNNLLLPYCNRHWCGLQENQLCAGKLAGGVDACQGDSGGPLQVQIRLPNITKVNIHNVIGVTSFGIGCARPNLPGIYTRVSSFVDWIESIVWK